MHENENSPFLGIEWGSYVSFGEIKKHQRN